MKETVYIKEELKEILAKIGVGIVDTIELYRTEGDKIYFRAGQRGRFHMTREELSRWRVDAAS